MKRKFEEWLLLLWFTSYEGAKIRDSWRKEAYERGYNRGFSFRADETYDDGFSDGIQQERQRILTQWQYEMNKCKCEDAMGHMERRIKAELIKGETNE